MNPNPISAETLSRIPASRRPSSPSRPLHDFLPLSAFLITTMDDQSSSSLISSHPSTSGLQISLHPLALLTISDYITRHTLRQQSGPIVGALLGTQKGREIAIEHAYELLALHSDAGDVSVEPKWFEQKLKLCMYPHGFKASQALKRWED